MRIDHGCRSGPSSHCPSKFLHSSRSAWQIVRNWDVMAYNYRSCSGEMNLKLRAYHAGATDDLQVVINQVPPERIFEIIDFPWHEKGSISQMIDSLVKHEAEHLAEILAVLESESGDDEEGELNDGLQHDTMMDNEVVVIPPLKEVAGCSLY